MPDSAETKPEKLPRFRPERQRAPKVDRRQVVLGHVIGVGAFEAGDPNYEMGVSVLCSPDFTPLRRKSEDAWSCVDRSAEIVIDDELADQAETAFEQALIEYNGVDTRRIQIVGYDELPDMYS